MNFPQRSYSFLLYSSHILNNSIRMFFKKFKSTSLYIWLLLTPLFSFSQQIAIDSLQSNLDELEPKQKIENYNAISKAFWNIAPDSSLFYAQKALETARKYNYQAGITDALNRMGNAYYFLGDIEKAKVHYLKCLKKREKLDDPERLIQIYNNLAVYYGYQGNQKKLTEFYKKAYNTSLSEGMKGETATYAFYLGDVYSTNNNYQEAIEYYLKGLEKAESANDSLLTGRINNRIGAVYKDLSNYDKSLEYYLKGLQHLEGIHNKRDLAVSYNNIGIIHERLNNYDKAKEYYHKTLEIYEQLDLKDEMAIVYNNLGIVFDDTDQKDKALDYYQRSFELDQHAKDTNGMATSLNNIGLIYYNMKDFEKSLEYLTQSLNYSKQNDNQYSIANTLNNIAEVLIDQQKYTEASRKINTALDIAKDIKAKEIEEESYRLLSSLHESLGDHQKALQYYKMQSEIHDTIFSREKQNRIADIQIKYETEQKEKEIQLLKKDNEIHKLEIKKQKNFRNFVFFIVVLLILLIALIYNRFSLKKKNTRILEEKNKQLRQANEKLKKSEQNLRELNATKDKFFSIISHDLKNPFQALFGFSEVLYKQIHEHTREEIKEYSKAIYESAQNLFNLLQNLLQWSRSQLGSIKLSPQQTQIRESVEDIIQLLSINADEKNLTIDNTIPEDLEAYVDENVISTVMRNLLSNAIKFTPNGGKVVISGKEKKHETIISVSDDGKGISRDEMDKLFNIEKGYTTKGTANEKGTGLGLILCKELIEKSNGKIWVESKEKGSIFRFSLPKKKNL